MLVAVWAYVFHNQPLLHQSSGVQLFLVENACVELVTILGWAD